MLVGLYATLVVGYPPQYDHQDYNDDGGHYAHEPTPYHFEYGVKDLHTHDIKSQHEASDGHGNVKGSYSLVESDGSIRVVEYTADHEHGFNAVVKKIPADHHNHHSNDYQNNESHLHPYKSSSYYKFYR